MVGTTSNWEDELRGWLKPFLDRLGHKSRRRMCPLYVAGLIGPGDRKSVHRPDQPGSTWSDRRPSEDTRGAADYHLQNGIRTTLDWETLRHSAQPQSPR